MILTGNRLAEIVCDILKIPVKNVYSIEITCTPMKAASIVVRRYLDEVEGEELVTKVSKYLLVEVVDHDTT
jgi:hypothetical protein